MLDISFICQCVYVLINFSITNRYNNDKNRYWKLKKYSGNWQNYLKTKHDKISWRSTQVTYLWVKTCVFDYYFQQFILLTKLSYLISFLWTMSNHQAPLLGPIKVLLPSVCLSRGFREWFILSPNCSAIWHVSDLFYAP